MGRSLIEVLGLPSCLIVLRDDSGTFLVPRVALGDDLFPPGFDRSNLEVTSVDVGNGAHNVVPAKAQASCG